jgi:microcystin-dependent protein
MSTGPFRPRMFLPGLLQAMVPDPQIDPQQSPLAQPGNGPIAGYTNAFGLNLVNFDWITWHDYEWENWIVVDALLSAAIGFLNIKGFWKPDTDYLAGQSVFDPADVTKLYLCIVPHTSSTDFEADKPLYWNLIDQAKPPVSSVFGRIGDVVALVGDYAAFYAAKAPTEAHIGRTDNPHSTSWGNLLGKPATFPPSAHQHVEADITNLDKYTKAEVNALVAARIARAGDTMSGFLTLAGAPTQPLHAATKAFVEQLIDGVGAETHVGDTPPADPEQGQLWYRTLEPAGLFMWFIDADSSQWIQVAGAGGSETPPPAVDASVFIGETPPPFPTAGRLWFSTVEPVGLFIWYEDGDSDQWVQIGGSNGAVTDGTPIGSVSFFAASSTGSAPPGWLVCNNQVVTNAYPELRQYLLDLGSPYGVSGADPRVPELRGEFIRGYDDGRGVDAGRVFGSTQLDQLQRLVGQLVSVQTVGTGLITSGILRQLASTASAIWQGATSVNRNTTMQLDTAFDPTVRSGNETRPRNVALLPCIKAFDTLRVEGSAEFNIATDEQALAGLSTDTLMTPANTKHVIDAISPSIKAWGRFDGAAITTQAAKNLAIARTATGDFTFTMADPMPNTNYAPFVSCNAIVGAAAIAVTIISASQFSVSFRRADTDVAGNPTSIFVQVIGE